MGFRYAGDLTDDSLEMLENLDRGIWTGSWTGPWTTVLTTLTRFLLAFWTSDSDLPQVFSKQIQESPAVIITEGGSAIVTCERRITNCTAKVQWILTGSDLLPNDTLLINSDEILVLKNEMTVEVILQDEDMYEHNSNLFQNFSIIISNITKPLSGLTVWCGEWWAEGNINSFYEHGAVIAVTQPPPEDDPVMIFSHQSRNLTTTERNHVTIMCTKSNGTFPEWEFLLSNGTRYLYTQSKTLLENILELDFYNPTTTRDGFQNFSVTFNANTELNKMKIRCAAKETENSKPVFNSFEDIIIIEKVPGILDGLSVKAVATITTPTVAGTVVVTILAVILVGGIIFMVNKNIKHRVKRCHSVGPFYSNQDIVNRHEQSYNNSVNERIARNLELAAFKDNSE